MMSPVFSLTPETSLLRPGGSTIDPDDLRRSLLALLQSIEVRHKDQAACQATLLAGELAETLTHLAANPVAALHAFPDSATQCSERFGR